MSTSKPDDIYVWTWLAGNTTPVVAGVLHRVDTRFDFAYAKSYLSREQAIPLAEDLPLNRNIFSPPAGLSLHGVFTDGLPDGWGKMVIDYHHGNVEQTTKTYLLESGSNRFGALDFQDSPTRYEPRENSNISLDELEESIQDLLAHKHLDAEIHIALNHGTSIGGSRPKIIIDSKIVKLSTSSEARPLIRTEACALYLAQKMGLAVPGFSVRRINGRDALIIDRFDRDGQLRFHTRSLVTLFNEENALIPRVSYLDLAEKSGNPHEVFKRIVTNILIGNTDDHARNHAFIWDGSHYQLAPVFDLETTRGSGWDANSAMVYGRNGERSHNLKTVANQAPNYGIREKDAMAMISEMVAICADSFSEACAFAEVNQKHVPGILHKAIFEDWKKTL
ncbi:type II toxin-antitoxin system HipA family toxin [Arcanobacterium buesumense]|uniref:Type II toxin-antitoxin system HipA family toxin n=1 Tax=Arcanobacterium buesumense TaxID=2722751 RepID=A0A6H2ENC1_9ACTO|nr:type II toxin-antitoxin system HipA family toxin [Arcanobacterium buesumense]QJC22578.1 type II toxin-antitoxin system HipA family toxin [Arcanobacterium buesumense]